MAAPGCVGSRRERPSRAEDLGFGFVSSRGRRSRSEIAAAFGYWLAGETAVNAFRKAGRDIDGDSRRSLWGRIREYAIYTARLDWERCKALRKRNQAQGRKLFARFDLPPRIRYAVEIYELGYSLREISRVTGLSHASLRRSLPKACRLLDVRWVPYQGLRSRSAPPLPDRFILSPPIRDSSGQLAAEDWSIPIPKLTDLLGIH